jgi:cytidine deaminase
MTSGKAGSPLSETEILRLLEAARDVRLRAYAPYSTYQVGAAALGEDGHVYGGCNVENASYGLGMCAERVAMGSAVSSGCMKPVAIAVVTADGGSPCGACRQVLVELNPQMTVIIAGHNSEDYRVTTAADLLPDYFRFAR